MTCSLSPCDLTVGTDKRRSVQNAERTEQKARLNSYILLFAACKRRSLNRLIRFSEFLDISCIDSLDPLDSFPKWDDSFLYLQQRHHIAPRLSHHP